MNERPTRHRPSRTTRWRTRAEKLPGLTVAVVVFLLVGAVVVTLTLARSQNQAVAATQVATTAAAKANSLADPVDALCQGNDDRATLLRTTFTPDGRALCGVAASVKTDPVVADPGKVIGAAPPVEPPVTVTETPAAPPAVTVTQTPIAPPPVTVTQTAPPRPPVTTTRTASPVTVTQTPSPVTVTQTATQPPVTETQPPVTTTEQAPPTETVTETPTTQPSDQPTSEMTPMDTEQAPLLPVVPAPTTAPAPGLLGGLLGH